MGRRCFLFSTAAAVAIAALISACGGGGEETADEPLSPAVFIAKANRICEKSRTEVQQALVRYQKENGPLNPSDVGVEAVEATLLPIQRQVVARLDALQPPREAEAQYAEFLEVRSEAVAEVERRRLSSNEEIYGVFQRSNKMASRLQLADCSFG